MRDLLATLRRLVAGRRRLFAGIAVGLAAWLVLPHRVSGISGTLLAWDSGVLVYLVLAAVLFARSTHSHIAADAKRLQEGEWTIFSITVGSVVASFAAIISQFSASKDLPASARSLHVAVVVVTLLLSWLMTQTIFAFRYAHEFYTTSPGRADPDGGLVFPGEPEPDYLDFFYFSLVLGMTFQVSDVQITARKLRRLATLQGFLSFLFNTVIVALTVNIAAGLL